MARKSFLEKYERPMEAEVKKVKPRGNLPGGMMLIPTTKEIDKLMQKVPEGKLTTQTEIRESLAKKHKADFACPLVTGIFTNIIAGKAEEDMTDRGKKIDEITPYWRTLRTGGELNPKYPGGLDAHMAKLKAEGHEVEMTRTGKPKRVKDFEDKLVEI